MVKRNLIVQNIEISISTVNDEDYISLTDMANGFEGGSTLIELWLRNKDTIEFLGTWEQINNLNFNSHEFEGIKNSAGTNRFTLSTKKWVEATNSIGLRSKAGRYGGTYAHKDIAFEFGAWLSPAFKLYLIKEFQRLKEQEAEKLSIEWQIKRELAKVNYRVQTDAIQQHLLLNVPSNQQHFIYASEADLINMVIFKQTHKEWKNANPNLQGNQRDHASAIDNALVANLELQNSLLIQQGYDQQQRLEQLTILEHTLRESMSKSKAMQKLQDITDKNLLS